MILTLNFVICSGFVVQKYSILVKNCNFNAKFTFLIDLTLPMKLGIIYGRNSYRGDESIARLAASLTAAGHSLVEIGRESIGSCGCDMILSVGGDGTFLSVATDAALCSIPVLGVNLGRMGFLSENTPDSVAEALASGNFKVEDRAMLCASYGEDKLLALNEIVVSRSGSSILGVRVTVDGMRLPTYWADGLLVATPSGSTAYSLSVGGPIVAPSAKVMIIAPVAPHNLNVRPLVVPLGSRVELSFESREAEVTLSADNHSVTLDRKVGVSVGLAQFSLKRVCLENSNFINALSEKLFWGQDIRNEDYE